MSDPRPASTHGPDKARFVIAFALAVLSLVIGWDAWRLSGINSYSAVGPEVFPALISAGLALLALANAVEAVREGAQDRPRDEIGPMAWVLAGLIGQIVLLAFGAGFALATGWLFAATAKGFGKGPLWGHFLAGAAMCFLIYVVFAKGLQLALPAGPLERLI